MYHFDLAWWVKAKWGKLVPSVIDIIHSPENVELPRKPKKRKGNWVWTPPVSSYIKINVDGSYLGGSSKRNIGGVFRDPDENVLLQFGKEVQVDSTVHV